MHNQSKSKIGLFILHLWVCLAILVAGASLPTSVALASGPLSLASPAAAEHQTGLFIANRDDAGSVSANAAWTADTRSSWKNAFIPNERIRFFASISNNTTASRTARVRLYRSGPCQAGTFYDGYKSIPAGTLSFYIESTALNCPGQYTFMVYVTYAGATTSRSTTFSILPTGNVRAVSAWTADIFNNRKTTFNQREKIRFYGQAYNTTGVNQTAYLRWEYTGPCGRYIPNEGNRVIQTGYSSISSDQLSPTCPGNYRYTFTVYYKGVPTAVTVTFVIR